jgi:O-antigen ligase
VFPPRWLGLSEETPQLLVWLVFFYAGHIVCSGWIFSSELGVFLALITWIVAMKRGLIAPSFHILYYPLVIYGIASTASSLFAPRALHAFGESALWGKLMIFPMAITLYRSFPQSRTTAIYAFLSFSILSTGWGLVQYVLTPHDLEHRISGQTSHVMTYSGLLLPMSLLFLVLWLHDLKNRWFMSITLLTTLALLLTFTRSVWIGWIVAVMLLVALRRPRLLVYAPGIALIVITLLPLSIFSRVMSTFDTRQSSNLDRIRMLQAGVEIIKDYPLLGVGPANVKEVYPLYRKHDAPRFRIPHLHNNFVQLWAERGVLALAAYVILIALFLRECARGWRGRAGPWAEVGLAVTAALVVAGLFEFNFGDTEVFWMTLELMALSIAWMEAAEPSPLLRAP